MSKLLTIDEMLDCAREAKMPGIELTIANFEHLATVLARELAAHLGVEAGDAHFEGVAFAGTCAGFFPKAPGQPCPAPLDQYDPTEWEG